MGIGDRLKEERERLGFNQTDFAAQAGASKNSQYNYEKGERSPDAAYLSAVADQGVDVLYVVTGERTPKPADSVSAEVAEFLNVYQHINDADRDVLFRTACAFASAADPNWKKSNT